MTAEKMLSLFAGEKGLAILWRMPSLKEDRWAFQVSRGLGEAWKGAGSSAGKETLSQSKGVFYNGGEVEKIPAVSLEKGEAVRRSLLQQAAGSQAVRLQGLGAASMEMVFPVRRFFPAGSLGGGIAQSGFSPQAAETGLAWGGETLTTAPKSRAAGFSGLFPGMLASGMAGDGNRAVGRRLRQAASGREALLARSVGLLRGRENGDGDFDGLLGQLERQLAIELGAG